MVIFHIKLLVCQRVYWYTRKIHWVLFLDELLSEQSGISVGPDSAPPENAKARDVHMNSHTQIVPIWVCPQLGYTPKIAILRMGKHHPQN